jgi:hypothetical protein
MLDASELDGWSSPSVLEGAQLIVYNRGEAPVSRVDDLDAGWSAVGVARPGTKVEPGASLGALVGQFSVTATEPGYEDTVTAVERLRLCYR